MTNENGFSLYTNIFWLVGVIIVVGVSTLISIGVTQFDKSQLTTVIQAQTLTLETIQSNALTHYEHDTQIDNQLLTAVKETNRLLLVECVNNAKTIAQREACVGRKYVPF